MTHRSRLPHRFTRPLLAAPLLLAAPVLLAGCGASASASPEPDAAVSSMSGMPGMSDMPMPSGPAPATSSTSPDAGGPPKEAVMVCEGEVARGVVQALALDAPPVTHTAWADSVFTCTYDLPLGPMVLTVQVTPDPQAAAAALEADRGRRAPTTPLAGLGEKAFSTSTGITEVLRESDVLTVDTTALPEVFGPLDQRRTDLANEIAAVVLGCWIEHT